MLRNVMARILLVEDEPDIRILLAMSLAQDGHEVVEAPDGIEALAAVEDGPVDMVIADLMMPRMDGLELCSKLQSRPELADVPFLLLTGEGSSETQYRSLRAGADDFIQKPVRTDALLARIRGRLERRAERQSRDLGRPNPTGRWCSVCNKKVDGLICPEHGVETLAAKPNKMEGAVATGTLVGGRFRIERALGEGGMGAIYVATQLSVNRQVALKLLHPKSLQKAPELERFHLEARAAAKLEHPNVVNIVDFGVDEATGMPFIAMALVDGQSLERILAHGPLPLPIAVHIVEQVARGLGAAHAVGIVHRDLKAENVVVRGLEVGEPLVKVLDFGVAKMLQKEEGDPDLTGSNEMVGTPRVMSPEQALGHPVTTKTDIYALGCLLYECLTGKPVFTADSPVGLLVRHAHYPPPELPNPLPSGDLVPEALLELHQRLLAKAPEDRPASAEEVIRYLCILRGVEPTPTPPLSRPANLSATQLPFASTVRRVTRLERAGGAWMWLGLAALAAGAFLALRFAP